MKFCLQTIFPFQPNQTLKRDTESAITFAQNKAIRTNYDGVIIDKPRKNRRCSLYRERLNCKLHYQ